MSWLESIENYLTGARCDLVAHEDTNFIELLPLAVECEQRADFKIAGGDVEGAGDLGSNPEDILIPSMLHRCYQR